MDLDKAREKARALFDDVQQGEPCPTIELGRRENSPGGFFDQIEGMTPKGFPLPGLLFFGLTELLGLRDEGIEEKVAWTVWFSVNNATFGFQLRKFGLRMLCEPKHIDEPITREVLGKARALTDIVEAYLSNAFVTEQIGLGSFTIENLFGVLDERYRFLRQRAMTAYKEPPPEPESGQDEFGTWYRHDTGKPDREGGALGAAAVDAYFSRLEHLFSLAAGFAGTPLPEGGILDFLASNWPAKAKALLDLSEPEAKSFYDKLLEVREEWRNPLAHGGFLSKGGSLYFHLPGVGAMPARLRCTPGGVRLRFTMRHASFGELMALFDAFDEYLRRGKLRYAVKWIEAGMDVAFDDESRSGYERASRSEVDFENFLEGTQRAIDQAMNMDW